MNKGRIIFLNGVTSCRARNIARGDRYESQSEEQAALMAQGIQYAMTVHTDKHSPEECAEAIIRALMQ